MPIEDVFSIKVMTVCCDWSYRTQSTGLNDPLKSLSLMDRTWPPLPLVSKCSTNCSNRRAGDKAGILLRGIDRDQSRTWYGSL